VLTPLRTAQAAHGSWTQTEWTTPNAALGVAPSGTNQYFRPSSVSSFGQLVGTFGVCAGTGAWCQGPGDTAGGQTLRLAGNHKSDAGNLYSSDLNGDGVSELLFSNLAGSSSYLYWGQGAPSSPSWNNSHRTELPSLGASGIAVADLNGDGRPDIVHGNFHGQTSFIYWGQAGGIYGLNYNVAASSTLPTLSAYSVGVADLNLDGRLDIVFVNHFSGPSYIYWGQAGGQYGVFYDSSARTSLPGVVQ